MLRKIILATSIITSLTLAGCNTSTPNPSTDRNLAQLQNKNWVLTEINQVVYKADPTRSAVPTMTFDNHEVSGTDGCNQFMGGYAVMGTQIKFANLKTVENNVCSTATDLPLKFSQALSQVISYDATRTELKLLDSNNRAVIKFKNLK
ncbi:META domain-containing protein [Acinetobacter sp.]|uniref:META domain-containing protein n=1 Tax=Acinetobacter sp. TaxID=472 RepID=UPI00388ECECA